MKQLIYLIVFCLFCRCSTQDQTGDYASETLKIEKISEGVYQHVSYLNTFGFGKVACNGMIAYHEGEAVVFDAPTNDSTSVELIDWIENELGAKIKAVIPTHFHEDCVGGLNAFHQKQIPSYANHETITLVEGELKPKYSFEELLEINLGGKIVIVEFFGKGHTIDNVIGYFETGSTIFGGCLIKSMNSGRGFLGDADTLAWPMTVASIKQKYPDIKTVIPGHGKAGGAELLDYTIQMFSKNQ